MCKPVRIGFIIYKTQAKAIKALLRRSNRAAFNTIAAQVGCSLSQVSQVYRSLVAEGMADNYAPLRGYVHGNNPGTKKPGRKIGSTNKPKE